MLFHFNGLNIVQGHCWFPERFFNQYGHILGIYHDFTRRAEVNFCENNKKLDWPRRSMGQNSNSEPKWWLINDETLKWKNDCYRMHDEYWIISRPCSYITNWMDESVIVSTIFLVLVDTIKILETATLESNDKIFVHSNVTIKFPFQ